PCVELVDGAWSLSQRDQSQPDCRRLAGAKTLPAARGARPAATGAVVSATGQRTRARTEAGTRGERAAERGGQLDGRARRADPEASLRIAAVRNEPAPRTLDSISGDVEALDGEWRRARPAKRHLLHEPTEGTTSPGGIVGQKRVADDDGRADLGDDLDAAQHARRGQEDQWVRQVLEQ